MSAASARQSQRVLIDAPVRLTLVEAARTLPARALDLSEGGIRLSATAPLRVGDEVNCSLELDDERAVLTGRVRWAKPGAMRDGSVGVGVQFGELDDEQVGQIRRWLAHNSEHAEVVLLHVPSMRGPLRALGCVTADGLQLVAALPHLTPGTELEFQLGDTGSRQLGKIERIEVKPRAERGGVEIALRLQPTAATRSRRNLVYGIGEMPAVEYGPEPPRPELPGSSIVLASDAEQPPAPKAKENLSSTMRLARRRERTQTLHIPKTGTVRYARRGLVIAAAAVVIGLIWVRVATAPSHDTETSEDTALEVREHEKVSAPPLPTNPPLTAAAPQATPVPEPAPAVEPPPAPAPELPSSASMSTSTSTPTAELRPATPTAEAQPASAPAPHPPAEDVRLPALNSAAGRSEIFVPMQGSLNGVRTTQWTDPIAVVIDLPDARISSPELVRGLRGGGVKRVRVDETRPMPRVQILLNTSAAHFTAKAVPHGMLVAIEYDLRPLP